MSEFNNIVVLTGAGISAESGLKTFRDNGGLWEGHRVEEVATPEAYLANKELVQNFYNQRRTQLLSGEVHCNVAHVALSEFEERFAGEFTLVTQNVDNLHQKAGSKNVLPMHGELLKARCVECDDTQQCLQAINSSSLCIHCQSEDSLRPHIVWFGEMPFYMSEIELALSQCDLFISIGTSSVVYPAAGFQQLASYAGAQTVELNLEPSSTANQFDEGYYGRATDIVPAYLKDVL